MALDVYELEERVRMSGGCRFRYGWLLSNGPVEERKVGFVTETQRNKFVEAIRILLSAYLDPNDVNVLPIAALLYRFNSSDTFEHLYLESELSEHDDMDVEKTDTILAVATMLSQEAEKDIFPALFLEMEKRGLNVKKV